MDRTACPRWQAGKTEERHHGTDAAYRGGCRCSDAREDKRIQHKRWRHGVGPLRRQPTLGLVRRLEALAVIGWTTEDIARAAGLPSWKSVERVRSGEKPTVYAATADAIRDAYRELSGRPGPSRIVAKRAVSRGWHGPLAWHNLDDPEEVPNAVAADDKDHFVIGQEKLNDRKHDEFEKCLKDVKHLPNEAEDPDAPDLMAPFALVNAPKLWRSMSVVDRDYALTELRKHLTVPEIAARVGVPEGHVADAWSGAMRRARKTQKQQTDAA